MSRNDEVSPEIVNVESNVTTGTDDIVGDKEGAEVGRKVGNSVGAREGGEVGVAL